MIIDATDLILGRLGTIVAKKALLGEEIIVVNVEKAVIVGKKKFLIKRYKDKMDIGTPNYGPFFMRRADKFVRRTFRGMIPWKRSKGKEAYKRIKCYIGIPDEYSKKKAETIKKINIENTRNINYVTIKDLLYHLKNK